MTRERGGVADGFSDPRTDALGDRSTKKGRTGLVKVALSRGRYTADSHEGLKVTGTYWHFVDVVWVFVYPTLYLVPHLLGK